MGPFRNRSETDPAAVGRHGWETLTLLGAVFAILSFLVHEVYSLDVWWQVAIGRDILETGSIPSVDRYAALGLGRPYHDSHWLFQTLLGLAHGVGGMIGVQAVMIGLWAAALAFCYRATRLWTGMSTAAILLFMVGMASIERFLPRPETVTFACIAVFYDLLQRGRFRTARELGLLAVLQIAWTNSHGLFVIGPFMVGCYWLWAAGVRLREANPDFAPAGRALAIVLAATAVTPFGIAGWRYAGQLFVEAGAGGSRVLKTLGELSDTFGEAARAAPAFWFFLMLLLLGAAGAVTLIVRSRLSPRLAVVAGLCLAALTGRRNVVLFSMVASPLIAEAFGGLERAGKKATAAASVVAALAMVASSWFPLTGSYQLMMQIPARWGLGVSPSFFPTALPRFLDDIGFEGQVLNSNTLGGFYLYHSYPERLPLTDGRWEVYEPDRLERVLASSRDPVAWRSLIGEFGITGILLAHASPEARALLPSLAEASDWRPVYYDQAASFWMPEDHPGSPPPVDLEDPEGLPEVQRADDGLLLNAFLRDVGARELEIRNIARTLRYGARRGELLERLGMLQIQTARYDEAEATFSALLEHDARNATALNELAFLAYRRGELSRAVELLDRLLEIEPGNPEYLENRARVMEAVETRTP